jgi:hypothetical protein
VWALVLNLVHTMRGPARADECPVLKGRCMLAWYVSCVHVGDEDQNKNKYKATMRPTNLGEQRVRVLRPERRRLQPEHLPPRRRN